MNDSIENEVLQLALKNKTVLVLDIGDKFNGWPGHYAWGHPPKIPVTVDNALSGDEFAALMDVAVIPGPVIDAIALQQTLCDVMKHPAGPPHVLFILGAPADAVIDDSVIEWTFDKDVRVYK